MSLKLLVNIFKWVKTTSQFNNDLRENCNEYCSEGLFFEADVQYPENDMIFTFVWKKIITFL